MGKFASLLGLGAGGGGIKQAAQPPIVAALPKRADKEVSEASKRARSAALLRKGRRSTILTGGSGLTDPLGSVSRPQARAATLLG